MSKREWKVIGQYVEEIDNVMYTVKICKQRTEGGYAIKEVRTPQQPTLFDA